MKNSPYSQSISPQMKEESSINTDDYASGIGEIQAMLHKTQVAGNGLTHTLVNEVSSPAENLQCSSSFSNVKTGLSNQAHLTCETTTLTLELQCEFKFVVKLAPHLLEELMKVTRSQSPRRSTIRYPGNSRRV